MDFTFGIPTDGSVAAEQRIKAIISAVEALKIPSYEFIIIGNCIGLGTIKNMKVIPFDENTKTGWITKKKNMIADHAKFDNIVYLHDYIKPDANWYNGFLKYGNNFVACMNPIFNSDGSRYRDWTLFPDSSAESGKNYASIDKFENLLPYEEVRLSKIMYFSGAYFVVKKKLIFEIPFDEELYWGQGEDVKWSHQVREKYEFSINQYSTVRIFEKIKDPIFTLVKPEAIPKLVEYIKLNPPPRGYLY